MRGEPACQLTADTPNALVCHNSVITLQLMQRFIQHYQDRPGRHDACSNLTAAVAELAQT